jgi:hypothetical protein
MNEPRRHLPGDLKALRYLDALNAGDLATVASLWDEAADDAQLERTLTEIDEAMFQELGGKPSVLAERFARPRRRWAAWSGSASALAAACLLVILAWPRRDTETQGPSPPVRRGWTEVAHQSSRSSRDLSSLLEARRNLDESAMPGFVWPLENALSASTPLDLLD